MRKSLLKLGLFMAVLVAAQIGQLPNKRQRQMARQTVEAAYSFAANSDWEQIGYSLDTWSFKSELQRREKEAGRVIRYRIVGESVRFDILNNYRITINVLRERGSYQETADVQAAYTNSYSRDYVSLSKLTSHQATF